MNIISHIKRNVFFYALLVSFAFIFFYRLDYNTLASWDEAWYGSIAREIIRTGDFMKLMWNGKPYYDHPPMGFWFIALSYKLFGISEFSTRFPSAILGLFSILLVYKTAFKLFNKRVLGFVAAIILGTSVWYVIRVRSGNLDSIFIFFYILTVYLSIKSAKKFRWFPLSMLSFGGLMLSKTLVGASAIIIILFLNLNQLFNIKKNFIYLILGILAFILLVYPWYYIQMKTYSDFIQYHFFNIGTRNKTLSSYFHPMFEQPLFFIHMGVRKWYYIWLTSLGFLVISFKFFKKNILFLLLWNFVSLYPFLTSKETQLWHLIPVYVPLSFITAAGVYEFMRFTFGHFEGVKRARFLAIARNDKVVYFLYLFIFIYIALVQIKIFYKEVFPANKYIPNDVAISKAAAKYGRPIFLDDDYLPIAVFYSGKNIQPLMYLPDDKKTLVKFYQSDEKNFVVITRNWAVGNLKKENIPYKLLENNNSFSILTRP